MVKSAKRCWPHPVPWPGSFLGKGLSSPKEQDEDTVLRQSLAVTVSYSGGQEQS